jgi:mannose-6-phosphate isomerase-like protein (cupin superfamily)
MESLRNLIFNLENIPLSTVPYHSDVEGIDRFFSDIFPVHMAIHSVDRVDEIRENYTHLHKHDVSEINIIIGSADLQYKIGLEEEEFVIGPNTGVWIPAGVRHSANLIKGKGYFIAIRLDMTTSDRALHLQKTFAPEKSLAIE